MNLEIIISELTNLYLKTISLQIFVRSIIANQQIDSFIKTIAVKLLGESLGNLKLQLDLFVDLQSSQTEKEILASIESFIVKLDELSYRDLINQGELCNQN